MSVYLCGSKYVYSNLYLKYDTTVPNTLQYSLNNVDWSSVTATTDLTNYYTKTETDSAISTAVNQAMVSVFVWKGAVATVSALPSTGNQVGWVYHVNEDDNEYAWDGTQWEALGGVASSLPTASTTTLGGVKVDGTTITINGSGVISATAYTLPTASTTTLGGVKVDGTTIVINSGVLSVPNTVANPVRGYVAGYIIRKMTQSEYNALSTKDANTIYFIVG